MKRRLIDSGSPPEDTVVKDADVDCIFVCQNENVLRKFKERYTGESGSTAWGDDDCTMTCDATTTTNLSILDRLRRDIFPKMELENRILDLSLGLLLFYVLCFYLDINHLSRSLVEKAVLLANMLDNTISWLGEVPAGLKLNSELVQFLGLFFRYHIHLFKGYLDLISDYMPCILYTISLTCIPGITCFLSYTLSFSIVLLLHIHCFYAYACNLYSAQLKALVSLGRLLAGVKYNPLRNRVDSVRTHGDQLILGTLVFSTLLFLFPTTLLYYCVFTLVNLVLVLVQMCIVTCISVIRTFPIRELFRVVTQDCSVMCDVMIEPLAASQSESTSTLETGTLESTLETESTSTLETGTLESTLETESTSTLENTTLGNVFLVTAVYKSLGSCLRKTSLGNHKLSLKKVRSKCIKGDIIKISF